MYMRVNSLFTPEPEVDLRIGSAMPKKASPSKEPSFDQRLIALRKARGLTQVHLAKAAGVTQRAISYYETAGGYPPAPVVARMARALNVSADELLGIKPPSREVSKLERLQKDPESRRLWKRFQQMSDLPERDQRAVIRLINSLSLTRSVAA